MAMTSPLPFMLGARVERVRCCAYCRTHREKCAWDRDERRPCGQDEMKARASASSSSSPSMRFPACGTRSGSRIRIRAIHGICHSVVRCYESCRLAVLGADSTAWIGAPRVTHSSGAGAVA